ncbi:hypothetical protein FH972_022825 [Carpinus fangiana]|uniref:Uncharacterized protein n=1 Tax=Carpinus fangiana TaxID=176857 RepID=A0A5N6KTV8_9ROSI|nr:hypothetical protein FH972_022825 [Carpinus fangiana]
MYSAAVGVHVNQVARRGAVEPRRSVVNNQNGVLRGLGGEVLCGVYKNMEKMHLEKNNAMALVRMNAKADPSTASLAAAAYPDQQTMARLPGKSLLLSFRINHAYLRLVIPLSTPTMPFLAIPCAWPGEQPPLPKTISKFWILCFMLQYPSKVV